MKELRLLIRSFSVYLTQLGILPSNTYLYEEVGTSVKSTIGFKIRNYYIKLILEDPENKHVLLQVNVPITKEATEEDKLIAYRKFCSAFIEFIDKKNYVSRIKQISNSDNTGIIEYTT